MRKKPLVTLTASPASGVPRACSDCFIRMPGTLAMPPPGKSAGRLNMISIVWLAGRALSVLRRSDQVMVILPFGNFDVGAHRKFRRQPGAGRNRFGAPDGGADKALALRIVRVFLVEHDALRHRRAPSGCPACPAPALARRFAPAAPGRRISAACRRRRASGPAASFQAGRATDRAR